MFDPSEFIEFAKKLLKVDGKFNEDAKNRTIISRTYFGTLLLTRNKLDKPEENLPSDNKIHEIVVNKLHAVDENLGDLLFTLHENRLKADLDLNYDSSKDVVDSIGIADFLKGKLHNF